MPGQGTNIPGRNEIRNLTINAGSGNTGAAAVYYVSANTGIISNVSIISGGGSGRTGLEFAGFSVQGYFSDITTLCQECLCCRLCCIDSRLF